MNNLDPQIERLIAEQKERGGIQIDQLEIGTKIEAQTRNTLYKIEILSNGKFMVEGGKYFPAPTETHIAGSTFGGSMLKLKWLGIGMCIEMPQCVTTSVQSLKVIAPDGSWEYEI